MSLNEKSPRSESIESTSFVCEHSHRKCSLFEKVIFTEKEEEKRPFSDRKNKSKQNNNVNINSVRKARENVFKVLFIDGIVLC